MLFREIIAFCSQIHLNTLCAEMEFFNVKLALYKISLKACKGKKMNMMQNAIWRFVAVRRSNTAGQPQLAKKQHFLSFLLELKRRG